CLAASSDPMHQFPDTCAVIAPGYDGIPRVVSFHMPELNSLSRVAAIVSRMFQREAQTWDTGIQTAISRGIEPLTVWADRFCDFGPGVGPISYTSCRRGSALLLEPSIYCQPDQAQNDCVDQGTGNYTPCAPEDWPENCTPGSSRERFAVAHELGHF